MTQVATTRIRTSGTKTYHSPIRSEKANSAAKVHNSRSSATTIAVLALGEKLYKSSSERFSAFTLNGPSSGRNGVTVHR